MAEVVFDSPGSSSATPNCPRRKRVGWLRPLGWTLASLRFFTVNSLPPAWRGVIFLSHVQRPFYVFAASHPLMREYDGDLVCD